MALGKQLRRVRGVTEGTLRHPTRLAVNIVSAMYWRNDICDTWYLGHQVLKTPLDLWMYQEMLHELEIDLVIETGTHTGASALYLAHTFDHLHRGKVLTIDIADRKDRPEHHRIEYFTASSTSPRAVKKAKETAGAFQRVMVILDSDHSREHVLREMHAYGDLVTAGSYMIVEDGNLNGHPVSVDHGPGPQEAIKEFLADRDDFTIDGSREKFLITQNPNGFLKKA